MSDEAAVAQMRNRRLQVELTGTQVAIPDTSLSRIMYYLKCMSSVLDDCVPEYLTDFANWRSLSHAGRQCVIHMAREYPPNKIPLFIPVDQLPDNSGNEFLRYTSLEETLTALGIRSNSATMMALRHQVETQHLITVMAYTPSWARNNYYQPLMELQRPQLQLEWRRTRQQTAYSSGSSSTSSSRRSSAQATSQCCTVL